MTATTDREESLHLECGLPWWQHDRATEKGKSRTVCPDENPALLRPRRDDGSPRPFPARFPGKCARGDRIERDQLVQYGDDGLEHVSCEGVEEEPDLRPAGALCPRCFLELPVSGVCGSC